MSHSPKPPQRRRYLIFRVQFRERAQDSGRARQCHAYCEDAARDRRPVSLLFPLGLYAVSLPRDAHIDTLVSTQNTAQFLRPSLHPLGLTFRLTDKKAINTNSLVHFGHSVYSIRPETWCRLRHWSDHHQCFHTISRHRFFKILQASSILTGKDYGERKFFFDLFVLVFTS